MLFDLKLVLQLDSLRRESHFVVQPALVWGAISPAQDYMANKLHSQGSNPILLTIY